MRRSRRQIEIKPPSVSESEFKWRRINKPYGHLEVTIEAVAGELLKLNGNIVCVCGTFVESRLR